MTLPQALESASEVTVDSLRRVTCEMLQALVAIHKVNVVHRDIKPDNFLYTENQRRVKLCDFGFAEVMPVSEGLTGIYGTPPFMSPEMLSSMSYGPGTDVWSLGVTAHIVVFRQFPPQSVMIMGGEAWVPATGPPVPNLQVKRSLDIDGVDISDSADQSIRALLDRDPQRRPSA